MCFGKGGAKMNRRGFLASALGFLAAPPIVRATSIMPVSVVPEIWTLPTGPAGYVLRYDYARIHQRRRLQGGWQSDGSGGGARRALLSLPKPLGMREEVTRERTTHQHGDDRNNEHVEPEPRVDAS